MSIHHIVRKFFSCEKMQSPHTGLLFIQIESLLIANVYLPNVVIMFLNPKFDTDVKLCNQITKYLRI